MLRLLPSLVKKTCMTTKGKGKRREPSSLPHIRGARLLPSTGFPSLHSSGFILTERASACVRACVYEGARVLARASCLRAFVWGMCVRAYTREESHFCTHTRLCVCMLARGTGICSPRFFFFLPFDSGSSSRLSLRGSVFLLVEKTTREGAL